MLKSLVLVSMIAVASPAAAQLTWDTPNGAPPASSSKAAKGDPNRVICETQEEIGSRLGGKKVCKTKAEWDEERRLQRQDVERIQQTTNSTPSG